MMVMESYGMIEDVACIMPFNWIYVDDGDGDGDDDDDYHYHYHYYYQLIEANMA